MNIRVPEYVADTKCCTREYIIKCLKKLKIISLCMCVTMHENKLMAKLHSITIFIPVSDS